MESAGDARGVLSNCSAQRLKKLAEILRIGEEKATVFVQEMHALSAFAEKT